ncbi:MAG: hypothetical protein R3B70_27065 [Polyangiaceae bacterium]
MRLTVENLGRIRRAELDVRPLTVLAGDNGTNKTWTAYGLFALCEALRLDGQRRPDHLTLPVELDVALARQVNQILKDLHGSAKVRRRIRKEELFGNEIPESLSFSLPAPGVRQTIAADVPDDCSVTLELATTDLLSARLSALSLQISEEENTIVAEYWSEGASEPEGRGVYGVDELERVIEQFALARFGQVRCLPAERKLLAQIYPLLMTPGQEPGRNLPRPLMDFAYMMAVAATRRGPSPEADPWLARLLTIVGGTYDVAAARCGFRLMGGRAFPSVEAPRSPSRWRVSRSFSGELRRTISCSWTSRR